MKRGRPVHSEIRQNIMDLLFYLKKGYGYQIAKIYMEIFPKCTRESVYYHLKKGVDLGQFVIHEVRNEEGDFSWGPTVQKTYYSLGESASPRQSSRIQEAVARFM